MKIMITEVPERTTSDEVHVTVPITRETAHSLEQQANAEGTTPMKLLRIIVEKGIQEEFTRTTTT